MFVKTDGSTLLMDGCEKLGIRLPELVAACSLWASPEVFRLLRADNDLGVWYPNFRRARSGETRRTTSPDGILLDDNTYANRAMKQALPAGAKGFDNCTVCHVWAISCYDERYHTCIANLVILPSALASLSDYDPQVRAALQFRSWELYGWHPHDRERPLRPESYPRNWREPEAASDDVLKRLENRRTYSAAV